MLGVLVLHGNLDRAAIQISQFLGTSGMAIGILPTIVLASLRVLQAYASNHQRLLQGLFQHGLVTFWPLLLVIAGTVLSRDASPDDAGETTTKDRELVDLTTRRSTLK